MQTPAQQYRLISGAPQDANLLVALNSSAIYLGISLGTFVGGCAMNVGMKQNLFFGCTIALISLIYATITFICAPRLE